MTNKTEDALASTPLGGFGAEITSAMVLGSKGSSKLARAVAAYTLGKSVYDRVTDWREVKANRSTYTLMIDKDDHIYDHVLEWAFQDDTVVQDIRALTASTTYRDDRFTLRFLHDTDRRRDFKLEGHQVTAQLVQPNKDNGYANLSDSNDSAFSGGGFFTSKLCLVAYTSEGRDALLDKVSALAAGMTRNGGRFYTAARYGWMSKHDAPRRDLSTVILENGLQEDLVNDLSEFLDGEDEYVQWGLPWHRGYLFHGAPGTGKTSLATALATEFGLDVYYISLQSVDSDAVLNELFSGINRRSAVIIEDVDIVHGAKNRDDDAGGVSLAGLLNALDGMVTPHGMILMMTTNDLDVLDPALVRPGRVDRSVEIGFVDDDQVRRMCDAFLGEEYDLPPVTRKISPAQVVEVFKSNRKTPENVEKELHALLLSTDAN